MQYTEVVNFGRSRDRSRVVGFLAMVRRSIKVKTIGQKSNFPTDWERGRYVAQTAREYLACMTPEVVAADSRVPGSGVTRVEGLDEERPPRHP